jgi:pheromone a factor receptor
MMRAELPVLSFLCAGLLVTILPMHIRRFNPSFLVIIAWLFVGNVIRGFSATNADVHAPAYCDIGEQQLPLPFINTR